MERVGGRYEKMEGHCSTGQSPQWAVVPMEEEEEEEGKEEEEGEEELITMRMLLNVFFLHFGSLSTKQPTVTVCIVRPNVSL